MRSSVGSVKFEKAEVYSWGTCKECDKGNAREIRKLLGRRKAWGFITFLPLLMLFDLAVSYLIGTDYRGLYHIRGKGGSALSVTWGQLLGFFIVVSIVGSVFLSLYVYYRMKAKNKQTESYGDW